MASSARPAATMRTPGLLCDRRNAGHRPMRHAAHASPMMAVWMVKLEMNAGDNAASANAMSAAGAMMDQVQRANGLSVTSYRQPAKMSSTATYSRKKYAKSKAPLGGSTRLANKIATSA